MTWSQNLSDLGELVEAGEITRKSTLQKFLI